MVEMLESWCSAGMFTMGDASSPTNRTVIPAISFIYSHIAKLEPEDPQRVSFVKTLAYAAEDCQGVLAADPRTFMRSIRCKQGRS